MEKLVFLLGDADAGVVPRDRVDLRDTLLGLGGALRREGALRADLTVADLHDPVADEVAQFNAYGLLDAKLSVWVDSVDVWPSMDKVLQPLATRVACYLVTESIPRALADHRPQPGERSPGVQLVTTFPRPDRLDIETFHARWHGSHTPLSLETHPLLAYNRNSVARVLTPGAPRLDAIVHESVASTQVVADPVAFYRSREDQKRVQEDLLSFVDFPELSMVLMNEYTLLVGSED